MANLSKTQTVAVNLAVVNNSVVVASKTLSTQQVGATTFLTGPTGPQGPKGDTGATGASITDASLLTTGTLSAARLPALTGDITTSAGSSVTAISTGVIVNSDVNATANIDATKLGTGIVNNTEFNFLDGVTSAIQTQLNAKQATLSLTTTGTSGVATLVGSTLNVPNYATGGGSGTVTSVTSTTTDATVATGTTTPAITIVSAPKLTTGRTLALTGDVSYTSPSFDGSANVTAPATLATVNSNVGTFGSASSTVIETLDAKGRNTAISATPIQIAESQVTNLTADLAAKQASLILTTTGTSGAATLSAGTLNIPQYTGGGGSAGVTRSIINFTTSIAAGATALVDYVYWTTTATSFTLTLPTAVSNTNLYTFKNLGTALQTVATTASQTIDGLTTIKVQPGDSVDIISNNANWLVV